MDKKQKAEMLEKAKEWMEKKLFSAHKKNILKLTTLNQFNLNPFTLPYLGYLFKGNNDPITLAKTLIYPRILGTSISTTFGMSAQKFIVDVFDDVKGSTTHGIDIEFIDKTDNRKKYCQVKSGPNVINKDDVKTIEDHFKGAINLARTNGLPVQTNDFIFGLLYGNPGEENSFIQMIKEDYVVAMGKDFWHRITGDENFYSDLIKAIVELASKFNMSKEIEEITLTLAREIEQKNKEMIE